MCETISVHSVLSRAPRRILVLWLWLGAAVSGQDLPTSTAEHGAFAFPDAAGTRSIVTSALPEPERLETVLCRGNVRGQAVFERWQGGRQGGTGRQSPGNFADLAGSVFGVKTGKLDETGTCFLATGSLLSGSTVVPVARPTEPAPCTPNARSSLASLRGRQVVNCWVIARLNEDGQIVLAEFARRGTDALASVVLMQGGRSIFADYPAKYPRKRAESVARRRRRRAVPRGRRSGVPGCPRFFSCPGDQLVRSRRLVALPVRGRSPGRICGGDQGLLVPGPDVVQR